MLAIKYSSTIPRISALDTRIVLCFTVVKKHCKQVVDVSSYSL